MLATAQLPKLTDLNSFIGKIPRYPVSVTELLDIARTWKVSGAVMDFYKQFPADETFEDQDDLSARSEQVQIMASEQAEQPWEQLAPQE